MDTKNKNEDKKTTNAKPISLSPIPCNEALKELLAVKPVMSQL